MRKIRLFFLLTLLAGVLFTGRAVWTDPAPSAELSAWDDAPSAEGRLGWALWDITQKTGNVAKAVTNSVTSSIGDYVKEKQKQNRRDELVEKFYANLGYVMDSQHVEPQDRDELTARVKHIYIADAESGRRQLDSLHFSQLPHLVRREHAEILRARIVDGETDTYYLNGALKTHWTLKNGRPDGAIVTYYPNGEIRYIDLFKAGRKLRRSKYDAEGKLIFTQNYDYGSAAAETAEPPAATAPVQEASAAPEIDAGSL